MDVLHAIGGWRGLVETSLPSLLFLIFFTVTKDLNLALVIAVAAAGIFTVLRLVQRSKLIPAVSGIVGVAICAFTAFRTWERCRLLFAGVLDKRHFTVLRS